MIINWGDAPFKAFITVTYPSGACTVSLGSKSYSHSGGGTHTFTVNQKGTWTVRATSNAGVVETQNVSLTYVGQVASVTLTGIFYAIKNGVSNVGEFVGVRWTDGIYEEGAITVYGSSDGYYAFGRDGTGAGAARSGSTVDCAQYKTLRITYEAEKTFSQAMYYLCMCDANAQNYQSFEVIVKGEVEGYEREETVATLDLSDISDELYVGLLWTNGWTASDIETKLYIKTLEFIP